MDRHPQQIKRTRQDLRRRANNLDHLSRLRTALKKVLASSDAEQARGLYHEAVKTLDKMAARGVIPKNTAARRKARITRHLNSLS